MLRLESKLNIRTATKLPTAEVVSKVHYMIFERPGFITIPSEACYAGQYYWHALTSACMACDMTRQNVRGVRSHCFDVSAATPALLCMMHGNVKVKPALLPFRS